MAAKKRRKKMNKIIAMEIGLVVLAMGAYFFQKKVPAAVSKSSWVKAMLTAVLVVPVLFYHKQTGEGLFLICEGVLLAAMLVQLKSEDVISSRIASKKSALAIDVKKIYENRISSIVLFSLISLLTCLLSIAVSGLFDSKIGIAVVFTLMYAISLRIIFLFFFLVILFVFFLKHKFFQE